MVSHGKTMCHLPDNIGQKYQESRQNANKKLLTFKNPSVLCEWNDNQQTN
jgi:hypothetical protein